MLLALTASYLYRKQISNTKENEVSNKPPYYIELPVLVAICVVEFISLAVAIPMAASTENKYYPGKIAELHIFFAMIFPTFYIIFALIGRYYRGK